MGETFALHLHPHSVEEASGFQAANSSPLLSRVYDSSSKARSRSETSSQIIAYLHFTAQYACFEPEGGWVLISSIASGHNADTRMPLLQWRDATSRGRMHNQLIKITASLSKSKADKPLHRKLVAIPTFLSLRERQGLCHNLANRPLWILLTRSENPNMQEPCFICKLHLH